MKTRVIYFTATWLLLLWGAFYGPPWALYVGLGLNCAGLIVAALAGHMAMLERVHKSHPQPPRTRPPWVLHDDYHDGPPPQPLHGWVPRDDYQGCTPPPPKGHSAVPPLPHQRP